MDIGTTIKQKKRFPCFSKRGAICLECKYIGHYVDDKGRVYMAYRPNGLIMSAYVRLEADQYRTRFLYNPGHNLKTYDIAGNMNITQEITEQ